MTQKVTNENGKVDDFIYEFHKELKISLIEDTLFD